MRVVVLGGGSSTERDVSLRSSAAVRDALADKGHEVIAIDPADRSDFAALIPSDAIVFPMLHGTGYEDGEIQRYMESYAIRFLGSDSTSSEKCFDKWQTRTDLQAAGLPVAQGALVTQETYLTHPLAAQPHVLKVDRGGSSIGTLMVPDPALLDRQQLAAVFALDAQAVLEELVTGIEITVPVLDDEPLSVIEIRPPAAGGFDYENKYNGKTLELLPPESISAEVQREAQAIAVQVHRIMGCRHLSRTDIIVRPDNSLVILEINTLPGMTDQSLFPKAAAAAGLPMPELMERFIAMVKRDYDVKEA